MKNALRYLSSFIAPVVVCLVIPALILTAENSPYDHPWITSSTALAIGGLAVFFTGLILFITSTRLFILIGNGTIMPWDPTCKLIVVGVYRHVRNPMILSLLLILVGEAIFFTSLGIALLTLFFFVVNTIYFIYSEEPGLEKRFGEEYHEYKENVPRWIPRLKAWQPAVDEKLE